jgi:hypothetical protein
MHCWWSAASCRRSAPAAGGSKVSVLTRAVSPQLHVPGGLPLRRPLQLRARHGGDQVPSGGGGGTRSARHARCGGKLRAVVKRHFWGGPDPCAAAEEGNGFAKPTAGTSQYPNRGALWPGGESLKEVVGGQGQVRWYSLAYRRPSPHARACVERDAVDLQLSCPRTWQWGARRAPGAERRAPDLCAAFLWCPPAVRKHQRQRLALAPHQWQLCVAVCSWQFRSAQRVVGQRCGYRPPQV